MTIRAHWYTPFKRRQHHASYASAFPRRCAGAGYSVGAQIKNLKHNKRKEKMASTKTLSIYNRYVVPTKNKKKRSEGWKKMEKYKTDAHISL